MGKCAQCRKWRDSVTLSRLNGVLVQYCGPCYMMMSGLIKAGKDKENALSRPNR